MIEREGGARDNLVTARGNIFALYTGRNLFVFLLSFLTDILSFLGSLSCKKRIHRSSYTPYTPHFAIDLRQLLC
jgi:hypothetical protein